MNTVALVLWIVALFWCLLSVFLPGWTPRPADGSGRPAITISYMALGLLFFTAAWGVEVASRTHTIHF
jgi:hypothetical protein